MRIHHAYVGLALMLFSALSIACDFHPFGDHNPLIAWGAFATGLIVFLHDAIWHLTHRR